MRPTFIACCARSGSTLLRWLIDSHPEVSCPAETDIALALASCHHSVQAMWGPEASTVPARKAVEALIEHHLLESHKRVFCDKSMSNALNLDLLAKAWLGAHFIFLHRHVMDFIASAIDAQPWGLSDYGFSGFASQYPGNDVAALARYWLERTSRMLTFEQSTGHRCVPLRYEDLVEHPVESMTPVWTLLGVQPIEDDPDASLRGDHGAHGNSDHLIWYTKAVSTASVGSGARVPADRIAGALRREVNALLEQLHYPVIDDAWGAGRYPGGQLIGNGHVRIVHRHDVVSETFDAPTPGTIAIERSVAPLVATGKINLGMALRSRDIRYYGTRLSGYGEEREVMAQLRGIVRELI